MGKRRNPVKSKKSLTNMAKLIKQVKKECGLPEELAEWLISAAIFDALEKRKKKPERNKGVEEVVNEIIERIKNERTTI